MSISSVHETLSGDHDHAHDLGGERAALGDVRPVGERLRAWRLRRRISQLELASEAGVSTRHISFVETGRAMPSREMVLRLAEHLEVPLRDRNLLLVAAGFAPVYPETPIQEPRMDSVRAALRQVLAGHEPYPAVVVDRHWNLIESNAAIALFTQSVAPALLEPPVNVLRVSLHPDGMARHIVNLREWRAHMLGRLKRHVALTADPTLTGLHRELAAYPADLAGDGGDADDAGDVERGGRVVEFPAQAGADVVIPLRLRSPDGELSFFSTIATFGTPVDITVAELAIESFYPADPATAEVLRRRAR